MFEILIILVLVGVIITAFTLIPTLVNDAGGELQKLPSRLLTSEEHDTTDPWSPEAIALRRHAMQAAGWKETPPGSDGSEIIPKCWSLSGIREMAHKCETQIRLRPP